MEENGDLDSEQVDHSGSKDSYEQDEKIDVKSEISNLTSNGSDPTTEHETEQLKDEVIDENESAASNENLKPNSLEKQLTSNEQTTSPDDSDDQLCTNLELSQITSDPQSPVVKIKHSNANITEIWHFEGIGSVHETTSKESLYSEKPTDDFVCGDQKEEQVVVARKDSLNEFKDFDINNGNCSSQESPLDLSSADLPPQQNEECPEEETEEEQKKKNESCSLLDHSEYYYVSSDESDVEVVIKIPKLAFADSVLQELSSACPSYKLMGIGRRNKDQKDTVEQIMDQNTPELDSICNQYKEVPKPYTNIFPDKAQPEICEIFLNEKLQSQRQAAEEEVEEKDSTDKTEQTFIVANEASLNSETTLPKFFTLHKNFDPSRIIMKRSASTLTDPVGTDWAYWKGFINPPSTSVESTQTKIETFSNYNEFLLNTDSAKALDSQLNVVMVGTEPYLEIESSSSASSSSQVESKEPPRTLFSISSWRTFTLSSGYSHEKLSNVIENVTIAPNDSQPPDGHYGGKLFDKLDKIGGGGTRSEQKLLLKKSDPKYELCTSDTSISSVTSEIPKGRKHSRKHAQLKASIGKSRSKFNQKQFMMPTEGTMMTNVEEVKEQNFEETDAKARKGYSNSSSSCFSLPDDAETDNYDVEGDNMKEGVFPLIKAPDDELGLNHHFGGDELVTSTVEKIDSVSLQEESSDFDDDDEDDDDAEEHCDMLTTAPSSGKSSKGSVYSVGASLPPIPSATIHSQKRSSQSQSPRMGRLALQSHSGKRLILNKVKPSSSSSVSNNRASEETPKSAKTETTKRTSDNRKPHECDSIHGLLLSTEDLNGNKKIDDQKVKISTITKTSSYDETCTKNNRSRLSERGEEKRAFRQSSSRVRHWISAMFRWCDARTNQVTRRHTTRRNTIK